MSDKYCFVVLVFLVGCSRPTWSCCEESERESWKNCGKSPWDVTTVDQSPAACWQYHSAWSHHWTEETWISTGLYIEHLTYYFRLDKLIYVTVILSAGSTGLSIEHLKMIGKGFYRKWVKSSYEQFITTQTLVGSTKGWIISQNLKFWSFIFRQSSESVTSYNGYVYVGCALSLVLQCVYTVNSR